MSEEAPRLGEQREKVPTGRELGLTILGSLLNALKVFETDNRDPNKSEKGPG